MSSPRRSTRSSTRAPSSPAAAPSSPRKASSSSTASHSSSSSRSSTRSKASSVKKKSTVDSRAEKENVEPETDEDDAGEGEEAPPVASTKRKRPSPTDADAVPKRNKIVRSESSSSDDASSSLSPLPQSSFLAPSTPTKLPSPTVFASGRALLRCSSAFLSSSPTGLVGRAPERTALHAFLQTTVKDATRTMYVAGQPGTGKTALVSSVLSELREGTRGEWRSGMVNCVGLKSDVWEIFGRALGLDGSIKTQDIFEAALKKASRKTKFLLVLDELDALVSLTASTSTATPVSLLLESIFLLPSSHSNLRIVAIANSLDFPTRFLSRLDSQPALLPFTAYGNEELSAIVRARLRSLLPERDDADDHEDDKRPTPLIDDKAIELAARKVQAENGDLRMCLDVCRLSIEAVEADIRKKALVKAGLAASSSSDSLLSAGPAPSPTAGFDALSAPRAGMTHILKALSTAKAAASTSCSSSARASPFASTTTVSQSASSSTSISPSKARAPSSQTIQKIKSLNIQSRLILVALLVHSRRSSWGLPALGLRPSASSSSPAISKLLHLTTTATLHTTYVHLLTSKDSPLSPVSPSDFQTLVSNLADAALVRLSLLSPSKRRAAAGGGAGASAAERRIDLGCLEDEVVKGLVGGVGAEEEEARRILEREEARIERAREGRTRERAREKECPVDERL